MARIAPQTGTHAGEPSRWPTRSQPQG